MSKTKTNVLVMYGVCMQVWVCKLVVMVSLTPRPVGPAVLSHRPAGAALRAR